MSQNIVIVYKYNYLYKILKELEKDINFRIIEASSEISLSNEIKNLISFLVITKKNITNINNQITLKQAPFKIFQLIEKINIKFLEQNYKRQAQFKINDYKINLNSRELSLKDLILKLTEKEINTIMYLSKVDKSISVDELQKNVWGYQSDTETHTVETHIYRLRKKIFDLFNDDTFIISKNNGYQITSK